MSVWDVPLNDRVSKYIYKQSIYDGDLLQTSLINKDSSDTSAWIGHMYQMFGVSPVSVNLDTCILFCITMDYTHLQYIYGTHV